jgi:hypothetical protein
MQQKGNSQTTNYPATATARRGETARHFGHEFKDKRRRKGRSRAGHVHELGAPSFVGAAHAEEGVRQERHHENVLGNLLVDRYEDGLSWRWDTGRSGWRSRRCSSRRPRHCRGHTQAGCKLVRLD